jgi:hypothetical protein
LIWYKNFGLQIRQRDISNATIFKRTETYAETSQILPVITAVSKDLAVESEKRRTS